MIFKVFKHLYLQTLIETISENLDKSNTLQHSLKNYEARDRNIQESNYSRVNFFSMLHLFVLVSVGLVYVLTIRSLFEDKSRVSIVMKART